jgi:nitroreductase
MSAVTNLSEVKQQKQDLYYDNPEFFKHINKSVLKGQRCQRNWDLSRQLSPEQLQLIVHSATQCPTKQNTQFYSLVVTQDRDIIEAIHDETYFTEGKGPIEGYTRSNPQVLANTLLVFTRHELTSKRNTDQRLDETDIVENDRQQAIGIAAGFVNMTASLIGLQTGCCKCMHRENVKNILGINEEPLLLMGVGFRDPTRGRRYHQTTNEYIGSFKKKIDVLYR